jgi:alpha-ribazole phosphatase
MATLLLARHGETEWNRTHRWQGFTGPPLNNLRRRQADELAVKLAAQEIHAIYSSDTVRVIETAEIVAARLGLEVRQDPRLREVNFGEWEGLTREEINVRYAGASESVERAQDLFVHRVAGRRARRAGASHWNTAVHVFGASVSRPPR